MPDARGPEFRPFEGFWSVSIHEFCALERQANAPTPQNLHLAPRHAIGRALTRDRDPRLRAALNRRVVRPVARAVVPVAGRRRLVRITGVDGGVIRPDERRDDDATVESVVEMAAPIERAMRSEPMLPFEAPAGRVSRETTAAVCGGRIAGYSGREQDCDSDEGDRRK